MSTLKHIPFKDMVIEAAVISLSVSSVVGALAYSAQSGALDFQTPDYDVSVTLTVPVPACAHEDGSGSTLPCIWDPESPANNGTGDAYRINADGSITTL